MTRYGPPANSLFGLTDGDGRTDAAPLARRTDPETSKAAARAVAATLGARQRYALDVVRRYGGLTATEMSQREGIGDPRVLNRRLSELAVLGLVSRGVARRCTVTGKDAHVYWEVGRNV